MSFGDEWDKESDNAIKALWETVNVTAISLFSGVIADSPVGNPDLWVTKNSAGEYVDYVSYLGKPKNYVGGSFRANWYLTNNTESQAYSEERKRGENAMINGLTKRIAGSEKSSWVMTNNAPYANRLENGWSTQARAGIVAPNVSRVESKFNQFAAAANRKYGVS